MNLILFYRKASYLVLSVVVTLSIAIAYVVGSSAPLIYSIARPFKESSQVLSSSVVSHGEVLPCRFEDKVAATSYELRVPLVISSNTTFEALLKAQLSREYQAFCPDQASAGVAARAKLSAVGIDVAPDAAVSRAGDTSASWSWILRPKEAGHFLVSLSLVPTGDFKVDLRRLNATANVVSVSPDEIVFGVDVRTALGFDPHFEAWLKAIAAFLGVIGTVLAFPFVKRALNSK